MGDPQREKKIVATFLQQGHLLTPAALERLAAKAIVPSDKKFDALIIDTDQLEESVSYNILKNFTQKPSVISKDDFVSFYTSKFEKMRQILTSRLQWEFVSLNKVDNLRSEVHVIGMVRDVKARQDSYAIDVEDLTDAKTVIVAAEPEVEIDDVVAIRATPAGDLLLAKEISYADIPLRQPATGVGKTCFLSDLHLDEAPKKDAERLFAWLQSADIRYVCVAGHTGDVREFERLVKEYAPKKTFFCIPGHPDSELEYPATPTDYTLPNIVSLSNPATIELNGLVVLLCHKADISFLKKRYMGKTKLILKEDYLVLDTVPDILHCGFTHKPEVINYKSVTLVNAGSLLAECKPAVVDFASRDVTQVAL